MKDLSFFFRKSLMGSKMGRGFRNGCNDDNSTSTLNQSKQPSSALAAATAPISSQERRRPSSCSTTYMENDQNNLNVPARKSVTLEEMILQLELEEEMARKEKAGYYKYKEEMNFPRRMSCVNNSDILRSARNALNQYPRFSLDGRDAMYRSSFRKSNAAGPRVIDGVKLGRILHLPGSVGGENVIWCKPGVVATLMGLEAMPLPVSSLYKTKNDNNRDNTNRDNGKKNLCNAIRNQNLKRREKNERQQMRHVRNSDVSCEEIKRLGRGTSHGRGRGRGRDRSGDGGSHGSSSNGYCVMNPVVLEPVCGLGTPLSWPAPYTYS